MKIDACCRTCLKTHTANAGGGPEPPDWKTWCDITGKEIDPEHLCTQYAINPLKFKGIFEDICPYGEDHEFVPIRTVCRKCGEERYKGKSIKYEWVKSYKFMRR